MPSLQFLQPLTPMLSAVLVAIVADMLLRLLPQARDRLDPLLGIPARFASRFDRKLNRRERSMNTRASRGVFTLLFMLAVGVALAVGAEALVKVQPEIEPMIWWLCLRITFPWTAAAELLKVLKDTKSSAATPGMAVLERRRVSVLVPTKNPDRHAVVRMLIEAAAQTLHRGLLAPVLWAVVAAFCNYPPLATAVFVTALLETERVIVTLDNADTPFAKPFQVIEAVINFVPARVAALLWVLGALFTPNASPAAALRGMFNQSESFKIVNSGWPVAAVAGALNVALPGGKKRDGWIGPSDATAKTDIGDVQRMVWLHAVTLGLTVLIFTATLFIAIGS
jgi:adenosylcobinamide-phosphate synthase